MRKRGTFAFCKALKPVHTDSIGGDLENDKESLSVRSIYLEEKLKTVEFKFFIGEQVWYRRMNRVGEVIACSFSRDYGYYYMVRIAYQERWQDEECDEAQLQSASDRLDFLLARSATPDGSSGGSLSDTKAVRTGQ
jgi:hypothetical protein